LNAANDDLFLRACRCEAIERPPLWIMRQAGRYLPEYREVRSAVDFITLCKTPELAAKVTLQPIDRFGFDAAILFSDILVLAEPMGFEIAFNPGPQLDDPARDTARIERIPDADPREALSYVYETIKILRRELEGRAPLIGFAAAPFTLCAYLVEGGGSKNFDHVRALLYSDPRAAHRLLGKIARATEIHLAAQVGAGAQAIQLFDTWAGLLGPDLYREFALRHLRPIVAAIRALGVPVIYFALNAAHLMDEVAQSGCDVIGVDWRTPLDRAAERLAGEFCLQGNLDPCALLAPAAEVKRQTEAVLAAAQGLPGHVFNLGHGILPHTPIASVETLVETVRAHRRV
jgi:uroporphyrinogen decarboxylase